MDRNSLIRMDEVLYVTRNAKVPERCADPLETRGSVVVITDDHILTITHSLVPPHSLPKKFSRTFLKLSILSLPFPLIF